MCVHCELAYMHIIQEGGLFLDLLISDSWG